MSMTTAGIPRVRLAAPTKAKPLEPTHKRKSKVKVKVTKPRSQRPDYDPNTDWSGQS